MHRVAVRFPEVFQALADSPRLRVVRLLAERCLCELIDSLLEPQYKLSQHLKILKQSGLLTAEKDGRWAYHRLVADRPYPTSVHAAIKLLPDTGREFAGDLARVRKRTRLRNRGRCRIGIQTPELAVRAA